MNFEDLLRRAKEGEAGSHSADPSDVPATSY